MADKQLTELDVTVTPAATDIFGVRQSGDIEDKSQTRAQVHTLESGEHLILPQVVEPGTPTLAFGDGDTGFYEAADDNLLVSIAGNPNTSFNATSIFSQTTGAWRLRHILATATVPPINPASADADTGIGAAAADQLSLIAGGLEMLRLVETGTNTTDQLIIGPAGIIGAAATPALAFGDGDTGWFELSDDELTLSIGGTEQMVSDVDGKLFINTLTGIGAAGGNISTATPGLVSIYGAGFDGNGQAGNVEIWAGYANGTTAAAIGGDLILWGGSGGGDQALGGNAMLIGGFGDVVPGFALLRGGLATTGGNGGEARVIGGAGFAGNSLGGDAIITGGAAVGTGQGGLVTITGGSSGPTDGGNPGGAVELVGGPSGAVNGDGGDITLAPGAGTGSGDDGQVIVAPTIIGSSALPALAFGDGNTGFWENVDNVLNVGVGGARQSVWTSAQFAMDNGGGPALKNAASTVALPGVVPNKADLDTGLGSDSADELFLSAGGIQAVRYSEVGSNVLVSPQLEELSLTSSATSQGDNPITSSLTILSNASSSAATLPAVFAVDTIVTIDNTNGGENVEIFPALGDDLGAGVDTSSTLFSGFVVRYVATVANSTWKLLPSTTPTLLRGLNATGPLINDIGSTLQVPTLLPNRANATTGIGGSGTDTLAIITGSQEARIYTETSNFVVESVEPQLALTAFATGGQGSATPLLASYSVVTVVGTAGDSVRLPAVFKLGALMVVKNDDSTDAMDIFPASGDDLGAGTDTAVSCAAGTSCWFLATVADATWTQLA